MKHSRLQAWLIATALLPATALAAEGDMGMTTASGGKRVRITVENLTTGQTFSPPVFLGHAASAPPLWTEGEKASFALQRIAEEGNNGPLLSGVVVKTLGGAFGSANQGISVPPGKSRTVELSVDAAHPLISGAMMLVMTNDGFTGAGPIDAFALRRPMTVTTYAYDAGTERNNERGDFLVAMMGSDRDPESGVVRRHQGVRGEADAPGAWKFDPAKPVARITIAPVR